MAINEIKIFVDMDSVLTDFQKAVKKLGPKAVQGLADDATQEQKQVMYDAIEEAREPFWAEMSWTERGEELWKILKPYKPVILTSPGKFLYAPAGKNTWMNKNLPGISYFLEEDKWYYVEPNAVLIDDMEKNIRDWDAAGGLSILYEGDPEIVKAKLEEIMKKKMLHKQSRTNKPLYEIDPKSDVKGTGRGDIYVTTTPEYSGPSAINLPDRKKVYVYKHVVVMENSLGRHIIPSKGEEVHHKDENPSNNNLSNLELVKFKDHQKDHSHKTKFWNHSPRNKPGRKAVDKVVDNFLRKAYYVSAVSIPKEWEKQLKEKGKSDETPAGALKQKAESILNKIDDREIKDPSLFIRALNSTINYVTKMPDPSKRGLLTDLIEFSNDNIPKIKREGKLLLKKEFQKDVIHKAEKLKDDGGLLKHLEELFTEGYKRASIADALRRIAKVIYQFSISSMQQDVPELSQKIYL